MTMRGVHIDPVATEVECDEDWRDLLDPDRLTSFVRALDPRSPAIQVVVGAFHPSSSVTARTIWLPELERLDESARALLRAGFALHELSHLQVSSDTLAEALHGHAGKRRLPEAIAPALDHHRRWGALFTNVAVVVEDVRVDRFVPDAWPGVATTYRRFHRTVSRLGGDPIVAIANAPPIEQLRNALLLVGRGVVDVADLPGRLASMIEGLGRAFRDALAARSDGDVVASSAALLDAIEALGLSAGPGANVDDPAMMALDIVTEPRPLVADACLRDDPSLREMLGCATRGRPTPDGARPRKPRRPWPRPVSPSEPPLPSYRVMSRAFDEIIRYSSAERACLRATFDHRATVARRTCGALVTRLGDLVRRPGGTVLAAGGRAGARVDPRAYAALVAGSSGPDVWLRPESVPSVVPAVLVLVDCSGSMGIPASGDATRADMASIAVTALHLALEPANIPHAVVGYTTVPGTIRSLEREAARRESAGESLDGYARTVHAVRHLVFKGFDNPDASAIAAITPIAENLDSEAVDVALSMLSTRSEPKLLLVLTDGEPSGLRHPPTELWHLRTMLDRASAEGVRTVGIGLGSDCVRDTYPDHVVLHDLEKLPSTLLETFERLALGR